MEIFLFLVLFFILFFIFLYIKNTWNRIKNPDYQPTKTKIKKVTINPYQVDKTSKKIITYNFRVVGIGFSQKTKDACSVTTSIRLKAENNPYDKNAIAVYNQYNQRVGYIPRGDKNFLNDFHSHEKYITEVTDQYHNIDAYPVPYCDLRIRVQFCGDFEYFEKLLSEKPISDELYFKTKSLISSFKDSGLSDEEKLHKITIINNELLTFNKSAEKANWTRIPMQETIVLMNKLKMKDQLEFIENHFEYSYHTETQRKYITNYKEKHTTK